MYVYQTLHYLINKLYMLANGIASGWLHYTSYCHVFQTFLSFSSGRLGAWALSSWYRSRVRLSVSITCQDRCSTLASAVKSSVCSIDLRLSVALLLHPDLSIDKPGVLLPLPPPKWGGRSKGLEGTPHSFQTWGTVLIRIHEQYFSLSARLIRGSESFIAVDMGTGLMMDLNWNTTACSTFI